MVALGADDGAKTALPPRLGGRAAMDEVVKGESATDVDAATVTTWDRPQRRVGGRREGQAPRSR